MKKIVDFRMSQSNPNHRKFQKDTSLDEWFENISLSVLVFWLVVSNLVSNVSAY